MTVRKYFRGDTVSKRINFTDENDAYVDPDTVSIQIKDPDGTVVATQSLSDLSQVATGQYNFTYNIPSDATLGLWTVEVTATRTAGNIQDTEEFRFYVRK